MIKGKKKNAEKAEIGKINTLHDQIVKSEKSTKERILKIVALLSE